MDLATTTVRAARPGLGRDLPRLTAHVHALLRIIKTHSIAVGRLLGHWQVDALRLHCGDNADGDCEADDDGYDDDSDDREDNGDDADNDTDDWNDDQDDDDNADDGDNESHDDDDADDD